MSRLQNRAKPLLIPLINGASLQLTDTERFILSSWATMFTMVVEFADVSTMTTSQAEREDFAKTPRPLDHWRIWIGRSERLPFNFLHYAWGTGDLKGAPVPMTVAGKCDSQTTTFAVGNLLFLTFSTTDTLTKIEPVLFALQFGAFLLWPKTTIPSAYEGQFTFLSEKQGIALANAFINRIDARYAATNSIA